MTQTGSSYVRGWSTGLPLWLFAIGACVGSRSEQADSADDDRAHASTAPDSGELSAFLAPVFAEGMEREHIPGAVFVFMADGRVVLAKGYGLADVASRRPVDPATTLFPIASISKLFTATAVMQLADRGQLDLHKDVNEYLKSARVPPTYPEPITAANLLAHTAGLDELPGRRVRSRADVVPLGRFLSNRLVRVHSPGEVTSYSSYGIALAGLLVEDVTRTPFEDYLARHIWQPLGMARTFITVPDSLARSLATAYEVDNGTATAVPHELYQTPPTSSIVSTAPDMARFMIAHLQGGRYERGRILSDSAVELMHRQHSTMHPRIPGWAYGFQLDDANGRRILEHGGDIGGFSSLLVLLPDEGAGFFVAHHVEGANLRFDLKKRILDQFFPDRRPVRPTAPWAQQADRLRHFAGMYRANIFCHSCPKGEQNVQDFDVGANNDGTITVWDQRWVPVDSLYFASEDGRRHIGFAQDPRGRITALTGGSWRVLERIR
jgi:CubicO group peptidase (beta-lactamase class C family)